MARPSNPEIRTRLRDQAVDYVLSHGIADLALRPLAKSLKTNARMLVYHFGSREGLMREILAGLREREDARIRTWFGNRKKPRTRGVRGGGFTTAPLHSRRRPGSLRLRGRPAACQAAQPPSSARAFGQPACRNSRATRALVASSLQAQ